MPERYFQKFPQVAYNDAKSLEITRRVVFNDNTLRNPYLFYPYDVAEGERHDQFANRYYGDSYYSWLIYLSNGIVDPYYESYLTQNEFEEFLHKKYGSVYTAKTRIKHYQNNWFGQDKIPPSEFDALPATLLQYWEPVLRADGTITSYARRKLETVLDTNKINKYAVSNTNFVTDEVCTVTFDTGVTGRGQVASVIDGYVYLQHLSGTTETSNTVSVTANSTIYGTDSGVNTSFTSVTECAKNMLDEEEVYYTGVTYFDYEVERNEANKTIRVLDADYAKDVASKVKKLLK
jgi:hypothetical protein